MAQGDGEQVAWLESFVEFLREVHTDILTAAGGVPGERGSALYAAAARPFQSAYGKQIYEAPTAQAAALFHALIRYHPFVDGNKRTATFVTIGFLATQAHFDLARQPSRLRVRLLGEVALETAAVGMDVAEIERWLHRIFAP